MDEKIYVAICDDHPVIRYGLSHILNEEPDIEVVGDAATHDDLLAIFDRKVPDVTVLDIELENTTGFECIKTIREKYPDTRVLIYTSHGEMERIMKAVESNVQGYILKQSDYSEIIKAIRIVSGGGTWLQPEIATKLLAGMRSREHSIDTILSKREQQVLSLIAQGQTNKDIANNLFISERTVKFHVSAILEKLDVRNRTEAALLANEQNISDQLSNFANC